jgi:hypothetical protein
MVRRTPRNTFLTVLAALVVYLASIGPVAWILCNFPLPRWVVSVIAAIFYPIQWVGAAFPHQWMGYMRLWTQGEYPKSGPEPPLPVLREFLGILIAAWFIWNVMGWFSRRDEKPTASPAPDAGHL